jgi:hypothetical protein
MGCRRAARLLALSTGSHDYRFYGLCFRTDQRLPGLEPHSRETQVDVAVHLVGGAGMLTMPVPPSAWHAEKAGVPVWKAALREGTYVRIRWSGGGHLAEFVIGPQGRQVWAAWNERVTLEDVTSLLLGAVLGCVIRLRGVSCLHGSLVAWKRRGLVFLGPRGAGKSTTALALVQRGAVLVSDDLVPLLEEHHRFVAPFGQPAIRMRPSSAEALCGSFHELRPVWSDIHEIHPKRYLDLPRAQGSRAGTVPIDAIYLLGARGAPGSPFGIIPLSPVEAVTTLMSQRPNTFVLDRTGHGEDFAVLGRLAGRVPVRQLSREEGLDGLDGLIDAVLADSQSEKHRALRD